jgi:hypothetical protein
MRAGSCVGSISLARLRKRSSPRSLICASIPACPWRARSPLTKSVASSACVASSYKTLPDSSGRYWKAASELRQNKSARVDTTTQPVPVNSIPSCCRRAAYYHPGCRCHYDRSNRNGCNLRPGGLLGLGTISAPGAPSDLRRVSETGGFQSRDRSARVAAGSQKWKNVTPIWTRSAFRQSVPAKCFKYLKAGRLSCKNLGDVCCKVSPEPVMCNYDTLMYCLDRLRPSSRSRRFRRPRAAGSRSRRARALL